MATAAPEGPGGAGSGGDGLPGWAPSCPVPAGGGSPRGPGPETSTGDLSTSGETQGSTRAHSWASPRSRRTQRLSDAASPGERGGLMMARNSINMVRVDLTERSIRIGDAVRQGLYTMATERVQLQTPKKVDVYPVDSDRVPSRHLEVVSPSFAGYKRGDRQVSPGWTTLFLLLLLGAYLSLGAGVMMALERPLENERRGERVETCRQLQPLCVEMVDAVQNGTLAPAATPKQRELLLESLRTSCPLTPEEVDEEAFIKECNVGSYKNFDANPWTFAGAFYFAFTTLATIGFGDVYPNTAGGKIFVCFYALFGIPLLFFTVQTISRVFIRIELKTRKYRNRGYLRRCLRRLSGHCLCRLRNKQPDSFRQSGSPDPPPEGKPPLVVHLIAGALFLTGICVCLFALFSSLLHGYVYGDSLYYAYISLSTIGFGDFAPGANIQDNNAISVRGTEAALWLETIGFMLFILVGLSILAFLVRSLIFGLESGVDQVNRAIAGGAAFAAQSVMKEFQAGKMRLSSLKKQPNSSEDVPGGLWNLAVPEDAERSSQPWMAPQSPAWSRMDSPALPSTPEDFPDTFAGTSRSAAAGQGGDQQVLHESLRLSKARRKGSPLTSQRASCSDLQEIRNSLGKGSARSPPRADETLGEEEGMERRSLPLNPPRRSPPRE